MSIMIKTLLVCALIFESLCANWPNFIKPCSLSDPKKMDCFVKNANEAMQLVAKGDKVFKIPVISPLFIPEAIIEPGNSFKNINRNVTTDDFKDVKFTAINFDFENNKFSYSATFDRIQVLSKYEISGQISTFPVYGQGDFNATFIGITGTYNADYKIETRNGEDYINIVKSSFAYQVKRVYFYFGNLFNGDANRGKQVNDFIDENWIDFHKAFSPAMTETIRGLSDAVLKGYFDNIPIKNLFTP